MKLWQGPQAQTHTGRLRQLDRIMAELHRTHGAGLQAIGLYGSLSRGEDGPHSDIELFCVLDTPGLDYSYEWVYGPGKAEVNHLGPDVVRADAQSIEPRWALSAGAYARCRPLFGDLAFFEELRTLPFSPPKARFDAEVRAMVVGELYEWIGKLRNGQAHNDLRFVPTLACDFVHHTALIGGLLHRRLYSTGSSIFAESLDLPDLPEGYASLCHQVMAGALTDAAQVAAALETLWLGIGPWLARHQVDIAEATRWPWGEES